MNPLLVSTLVFAALFGSALLGFYLRCRLPDDHLCDKTKDAVRIGMGSVATMAALVLGLLVASTKGAYDTEKGEVIQLASKIICLDQVLANYGPEAAECRTVLVVAAESAALRIWPASEVSSNTIPPGRLWGKELPLSIQELSPQTEAQRVFKSQAAQLAADVGQMRWLLFEQSQTSIATPLLVMMVFWMALTYASVGLFAPSNGTVVGAQFLAALAVAGALFLILELDEPFGGVIRISNRPMLDALSQISK